MSGNRKRQPPPSQSTTSRRVLQRFPRLDVSEDEDIGRPPSPTSSCYMHRSYHDQDATSTTSSCACCPPRIPQGPVNNGPTCEPPCPKKDGITFNDIPSCGELLRKLAEEVLSYHSNYSQLEKRVSIQEPRDQKSECAPLATNMPEWCVPPTPQKDSCRCIQGCQVPRICKEPATPCYSKPPKFICNINPKCQREESVCSIDSCAKERLPKVKSSTCKCDKKTNTKSGDTLSQLRPMRPMPCSANNSYHNLFKKTSNTCVKKICICPNDEINCACQNDKKNYGCPDDNKNCACTSKIDCDCLNDKTKKCVCTDNKVHCGCREVEKKKLKKKTESMTKPCARKECAVNTCTCRFPPAYGQHYDCTGQVSGNCHCSNNN